MSIELMDDLYVMCGQIHQRVPLYIGSVDEVEKLEKYLA